MYLFIINFITVIIINKLLFGCKLPFVWHPIADLYFDIIIIFIRIYL